jgi:hypothetical protein
MSALDWFPEPFQAYGSFAGEGARRVLGKPKLDPLTVLVRETVQNSWDARRPDRDVVKFAMDGWNLTHSQVQTLRASVFGGRPTDGLLLDAVINRNEVPVLAISDRGTVGLTGPIRADHPAEGRTDFIDLVFNMGQPRDVDGGGGTYGFGKTISYVVSEASTCILYTRTEVMSKIESRLIAVAVGAQYATNTRRYTGRHWWGLTADERIGPVVGETADELADQLGMPKFEEAETGLSVLILAPRFGSRTPHQAMNFIAGSLAWNFWPKMVTTSVSPVAPMDFRVSWQGDQIGIPDPEAHPPLRGYVRAFRALHADEEGGALHEEAEVEILPVRSQRPNRQLGVLAIARAPHEPRVEIDDGADTDEDLESSAAFSGNSHHVALMRRVELVVKYLEGPELPAPHVEWAGVFISDADAEIDHAFAEAEPPTHDDWQPSMIVDKAERRIVNVALKNIATELRRSLISTPSPPKSDDHLSGVVIGNALGSLIASVVGSGTAKRISSPGIAGASTPSGTSATDQDHGQGRGPAQADRGSGFAGSGIRPHLHEMTTQPAMVNNQPGTEVEFRVDTQGGRVRILGSATAAIDGTAPEREPPLGARVPEIVGWRRPTETVVSVAGSELIVEPGDDGASWILVVSNPARTAIAVDVRVGDPA